MLGMTDMCRVRPLEYMASGEPVYGPWEVRKCRLEPAAFVSGTRGVESIPARARLFALGNAIPVGSEVECRGERYTVSSCEEMRAIGAHHLEVYLQ